MSISYDRIAGQSVERLAALSDGIFGVAMTLLLLELHVPAKEFIHSEADLWHALARLAPQLVVYLMSFITLGIFWVGQQTQICFGFCPIQENSMFTGACCMFLLEEYQSISGLLWPIADLSQRKVKSEGRCLLLVLLALKNNRRQTRPVEQRSSQEETEIRQKR